MSGLKSLLSVFLSETLGPPGWAWPLLWAPRAACMPHPSPATTLAVGDRPDSPLCANSRAGVLSTTVFLHLHRVWHTVWALSKYLQDERHADPWEAWGSLPCRRMDRYCVTSIMTGF